MLLVTLNSDTDTEPPASMPEAVAARRDAGMVTKVPAVRPEPPGWSWPGAMTVSSVMGPI